MHKYIDDFASLDIHWLKKTGRLRPQTGFGLTWRQAGVRSVEVEVRVARNALEASWTKSGDSGATNVDVRVTFCGTPCHFGGSRPWFCCPKCHSRCGKVYFARHELVCRRCLGLAYRCQSETSGDRSRRVARRVRRRLGASSNLAIPVGQKPKGMHQCTFDRLLLELSQAESEAMLAMKQWLRPCSSMHVCSPQMQR
jgi:hypothetical protein